MKISVITVSYNSAKTISDTLNSVSLQTFGNVEHVVVDGASTDDTVALIRKHSNPNIIMFSEPDEGIYDAMNKGLAIASGDIIGFLNSDDFYVDSFVLEKIAAAFKDESVQAIYSDLIYVSKNNDRVVRYWKSKPFIKGDFSKGWAPAHPTFYVRKSVIERLGVFDKKFKLAADFEFMLRCMVCGNVKTTYIPHVLVRMRLGGASNASWKNIFLQNKEIFLALKKNGVRFSRAQFFVNKIGSRIFQFALGHVRRYH